ncbi:MAG: tRNA adenosine(34) deaminase TadA [Christensenellales bacterium]
MEEKFMRRAIELAKEAESHDEVPIGAVIVLNGEIVAEGNNRKERDNCALSHAETVAIAAAAKKLGWYLSDCEMYVTLEPCAMCAGALINSRLKNLYFGAYDKKAGCCGTLYNLPEDKRFNHRLHVEGGILQEECAALLSEYFKKKRNRL